MKKLTVLFNIFCLIGALCVSGTANANSCFLATEDGSSSNCDNGSAQVGLPGYDSDTSSKKETTGLCNNVNAFADKGQALQFASTHDYDGVTGSNVTCWTATCTYQTEATCVTGSSGPCCKSLINDKCWHACDLCRFNIVKNEYYPYASDNLKNCEIIGEENLDEAPYILSDNHTQRNYKISGLKNLEPINSWNTKIWHCDSTLVKKSLAGLDSTPNLLNPALTLHSRGCIDYLQSTKMVKGYKNISTVNGINYLCKDGRKIYLSDSNGSDDFYKKFVITYGCPLSAIKCSDAASVKYDKYYNTASECETQMANGNPCAVVRTYKNYGDMECWHGARSCSDFGHDGYKVGNYNSLTCDESDGTEKKYYTNSDGNTVSIGDPRRDCGYCECLSGYYRISECNDMIYETVKNYYQAKTRCNNRGYDLEQVPDNKNSCVACPYSAVFWKCD